MEPTFESSLDAAELDEFVLRARGATFYHCSTWLNSLASVYGYRLGYCTHRDGGELRALLPFADVSKHGLVHRQSLAFGTYGGPITAPGADPALAASLIAALKESLGGRVQRLSLTGAPDPERPEAAGEDARLRTQILDLRPGWDALFGGVFRKERRRQIRKAEREGVTVERSGDMADLSTYYEIYMEHAGDWGLATPTPLAHLSALVADEARVRFWVARHEGEIVGGHLNFHFRGMITAWNGTARKSKRHLAPSVLLYARNLELACAEGDSFFNFGGSGENDPLFDFKAAFGAVPVAYRSDSWDGFPLGLLSGLRQMRGGA